MFVVQTPGSPATVPLDSTGARCAIQRIRLAGGWRGLVAAPFPADAWLPVPLPGWSEWQSYLEQLLADPTGLPAYAQLKYSPINEVIRAGIPCSSAAAGLLQVICKRSSPTGIGSRLRALVGRSRARRNFDRGLFLTRLAVGTAPPLALLERPAGGESWLICQYLPGLVDLDQIALTKLPHLSPREAHGRKRQAIVAVARFFAQLDRHRLHHRDLKATNILLSGWDAGRDMHVVLVDLDGLQGRSWLATRGRRQRLMRLAASLAEYPSVTRTDYARFLRELACALPPFVGGGERDQAGNPNRALPPYQEGTTGVSSSGSRSSDDRDWKAELRSLGRAAARYNRSAEARRRQKWAARNR